MTTGHENQELFLENDKNPSGHQVDDTEWLEFPTYREEFTMTMSIRVISLILHCQKPRFVDEWKIDLIYKL